MARILAIDWGEKRVGVAISDPGGTIATPLPTQYAKPKKIVFGFLRDVIKRESVITVIVGYPRNMDGSSSPSSEEAKKFATELLRPFKGEVRLLFHDERLTSWAAREMLRELGEKPEKGSGRIDQIVAASILQAYLDWKR
jgi:putative holliday junction resolvase